MKILNSLLFLLAMSFGIANAQSTHTVDFEAAGVGADWAWTVTENSDNPALEFVANPASDAVNGSATAAKFIARADGMNWALCHTNNDGLFTFDASNAVVKIMVYKPTISNVAIKFEGLSPAVELKVANTKTNQWEELTFDFSASIGNKYERIVIIPDFVEPYGDGTDRTQENVLYFDNIQVPDGEEQEAPNTPAEAAPVPTKDAADVLSVYSDAYTNLEGTNFNPGWGQSTAVTVDHQVAGNNTLLYEGLNYQGTEYTNQDVSAFDNLHIDFWTPNSTELQFFLISADPTSEVAYALPVETEKWVSVDIALSNFTPTVDLTNVFQFKVVGNGTVYFDNIYFSKGSGVEPLATPATAAPAPEADASKVLSVYSDAYTNLEGTDFNPFWGQATQVTVDHLVAGNKTLLYSGLNYQGTQFANQDVSGYDFIHVDFWTPNAASIELFLISADPTAEIAYALPVELEKWVSVDIPLSSFQPTVDLTNVFQFKVVGDGVVYFDNLYFGKKTSAGVNNAIENNAVRMYPNPASDKVELSAETGIKEVVIYNLAGAKVFQQNINAVNTQIQVTDFSAGTYFVKMNLANGESRIQKLVKK